MFSAAYIQLTASRINRHFILFGDYCVYRISVCEIIYLTPRELIINLIHQADKGFVLSS